MWQHEKNLFQKYCLPSKKHPSRCLSPIIDRLQVLQSTLVLVWGLSKIAEQTRSSPMQPTAVPPRVENSFTGIVWLTGHKQFYTVGGVLSQTDRCLNRAAETSWHEIRQNLYGTFSPLGEWSAWLSLFLSAVCICCVLQSKASLSMTAI